LSSADANRDQSKIASDSRALNRGVLVNAAGYTVKLGMPVLLAFGTRTYGAASWGVFVTLQALIMIALRIAILGLDKAMLWWIPNRGPDGYPTLGAAVGVAGLSSAAVGGMLALLAEPLLSHWNGLSPAQAGALRVMLLGLPLFAASELLLNACMGRRRMEPNVIVRETLAPGSLIGFALLLHACGAGDRGLAWAFVLSNALSLVAALAFQRGVFGAQPAPASWRVPRALFDYALPFWLAEILNTLLMRASALAVAAFIDPISAGVWSIVLQFGTAIRTIRGAFDSIVTVIAADIAREKNSNRLSAALSYAAQLVTLTQFPLFAFMLMFADLILPLYGPAFARGSFPLIVLCGFWLLNGAAGLAGVVLAGHGKSKLTLLNTILTLLLQAGLLIALVPRWGLLGAAIAVGASYSVQHLVQLAQLKWLTGSFHFSRRASQPLLPAAAGAVAAALVHVSLREQAWPAWSERSATFGAFLALYGAITWWHWKQGRLRAPGAEPARSAD
jgi:O-antigen/teichoic acid export membrane protein